MPPSSTVDTKRGGQRNSGKVYEWIVVYLFKITRKTEKAPLTVRIIASQQFLCSSITFCLLYILYSALRWNDTVGAQPELQLATFMRQSEE